MIKARIFLHIHLILYPRIIFYLTYYILPVLALAQLTSSMLWCIMLPAIYTLSKVLVPYESDEDSFGDFYDWLEYKWNDFKNFDDSGDVAKREHEDQSLKMSSDVVNMDSTSVDMTVKRSDDTRTTAVEILVDDVQSDSIPDYPFLDHTKSKPLEASSEAFVEEIQGDEMSFGGGAGRFIPVTAGLPLAGPSPPIMSSISSQKVTADVPSNTTNTTNTRSSAIGLTSLVETLSDNPIISSILSVGSNTSTIVTFGINESTETDSSHRSYLPSKEMKDMAYYDEDEMSDSEDIVREVTKPSEKKKKKSFKHFIYTTGSLLMKTSSIFAIDLWILTFTEYYLVYFTNSIRFDEVKEKSSFLLNISFSTRNKTESKIWRQRKEEFFPPFKDLSKEIHKKLLAKAKIILRLKEPKTASDIHTLSSQINDTIVSLISFVLLILVYTGIGHFATSLGRRIWITVIRKYAIFVCVCLGIWTDEFFECYGLQSYVDPQNEYYIGNINGGKQNLTLTFSHLLSSLISPRAVLLQVATPLTPFSVFAVGMIIISTKINYQYMSNLTLVFDFSYLKLSVFCLFEKS